MMQSSALLDEVASWFDHARANGSGVMVRCPGHDDRKQSLHISIGKDGNVVLFCHAGCETATILGLVGKSFKDLFGRDDPPIGLPARKIVATYDYVDEQGNVLYQAVRWFPKDFRQRRPDGRGGWIDNVKDVRRVPYHLDEILSRPGERVWIVEGEKDADRLRSEFGVLATCNVGGAGKWTDDLSAYLAGRSVVVVSDNDDAGRQHAGKVARSCIEEKCKVKILDLPGVPAKGDISDWLDLGGTDAQLRDLVRSCELVTYEHMNNSSPNNSYVHMFVERVFELPTFPVDVFPDPIRKYIDFGTAAMNVPADMIAMPLIGFAAGAIGNSVALALKDGWIERPNLWIAIVGDPGSGKTPALDYARVGIDDLQRSAIETFKRAKKDYDDVQMLGKRQIEANNVLLDKPNLEDYFTTDSTTQKLSEILSHSAGVTIVRDELVGWVKSHDAYNKAGDRQNFLSLWSGSPLKVDRRSSETIFVPHPCAPIVGGIQPDMLGDLAEESNRRDGFIDRLLIVWPDAFPQKWTDADVHPETTVEVVGIFRKLRVHSGSMVIRLDPPAKSVFAKWFDENAKITESSDGLAQGCYAKFPRQLARIALVLHCLRNPGIAKNLDESTMVDAVTVIEYLRAHLVRVLPKFSAIGSTESAALEVRVLRVLKKAGGEWISRRDMQRGLGNSVKAESLDEVLVKLSLEGKVENQTVQSGARPREESRIVETPLRTYEHMNILEVPDDE